ncbi:hypothetical protein BTA51_28875, partial [Hahella sp. CCB-MM4]|uniref:golvesin C-terminal-like domain-containing protein n=1 Tax=Hahella sp. (strain CCB-MM4) TaxID=1926491 RepID=UPI000BD211FA
GQATTTDVVVNQQLNGGEWISLGSFAFGGQGKVELLTSGDGAVVADAVKFATTEEVAASHRYQMYDPKGQLRYSIDAEGYVTEHVYDGKGREVETIQYDEAFTITPDFLAHLNRIAQDGGETSLLSTVVDSESQTIPEGWTAGSSLSGFEGDNYLYASGGQPSFIWESALTGSARQEVFAKWTAHSNRASNATYRIHHLDGNGQATTTDVVVNQQLNGGEWISLGSFAFGGQGKVELLTTGNGTVVADAVKFEAAGGLSASRSYQIYDAKGQVRYSIDAEGYVTEHEYDVLGREIATSKYEQPLDLDALNDFTVASLDEILKPENVTWSSMSSGLQSTTSGIVKTGAFAWDASARSDQ